MSEDRRKAWADPKDHKIWRLIGKGLILLSVCVGLIHTYLWFRYLDTRLAYPDPSQGRVYVMNNHGIYRYLTKKKTISLRWSRSSRSVYLLVQAWSITLCLVSARENLSPGRKNSF